MLLALLLAQATPVPTLDSGPAPVRVLAPESAADFGWARFGEALAVDSGRAVVGAPRYVRDGWVKGQADLFAQDSTGDWSLEFTFQVPVQPGEQGGALGHSVDIEGDRALVGQPEADGLATTAGQAWILERQSNGSWASVAQLVPPSPRGAERYGEFVDLDGDQCVVGSIRGDSLIDVRQPDGSWMIEAALAPTDLTFAQEGALSGDHLVTVDQVLGGNYGPRHWLRTASGWVDRGYLDAPTGTVDMRLALESDRLAVGWPSFDTPVFNGGRVTLYQLDSQGDFVGTDTLIAPAPTPMDRFGDDVDFEGDRLWVGSTNQDAAGPDQGVVWEFDLANPLHPAVARLTGPAPDGEYGLRLAVDGNDLFVGAPDQSTDSDPVSNPVFTSGAVHVYNRRSLEGAPTSISVSTGGSQVLTLRAGATHAGRPFLILGGASGWAPGLTGQGAPQLPFLYDPYTQASLLGAAQPPWVGTFGFLDGSGTATASVILPALSPSLANLRLHHAALVLDLAETWPLVTPAEPLDLVP